ncbi:unnamed protein product [Trichobilharzia szidati]|nr:unnamed protein product [Trichobilharzia szidati]
MASDGSDIDDYESCNWFLKVRPQVLVSEVHSHPLTSNEGYLMDNRTQRFVERYFNAFYLVDVGGELENDICLLRHSNTVCVVGLAFGHHIFKRCVTNACNKTDSAVNHQILGLDYQVSNGLDRLKNEIRGRRKHGSHILSKSTDILAYAVCDQGVRHPIVCGLQGHLLEVNSNLDIRKNQPDSYSSPPIHNSDNPCSSLSAVNLTPLIDKGDKIGVGTYVCIIMQNSRSKKSRSGKVSDYSLSKTGGPNSALTPHADDFPEYIDCSTQSEYASQIGDFILFSKSQKVLNWNEYVTLRLSHCT